MLVELRLVEQRYQAVHEVLEGASCISLDGFGEQTAGAGDVLKKAGLLGAAERFEHPVEAHKGLLADRPSEAPLYPPGGSPVRLQVLESQWGERQGLLPAAGRRDAHSQVSLIAQAGDDLGRALAADAEFPADVGDRRGRVPRTDPQDPTIGEAGLEAVCPQLGLQGPPVADPGLA